MDSSTRLSRSPFVIAALFVALLIALPVFWVSGGVTWLQTKVFPPRRPKDMPLNSVWINAPSLPISWHHGWWFGCEITQSGAANYCRLVDANGAHRLRWHVERYAGTGWSTSYCCSPPRVAAWSQKASSRTICASNANSQSSHFGAFFLRDVESVTAALVALQLPRNIPIRIHHVSPLFSPTTGKDFTLEGN
jgi:hypothetical protein